MFVTKYFAWKLTLIRENYNEYTKGGVEYNVRILSKKYFPQPNNFVKQRDSNIISQICALVQVSRVSFMLLLNNNNNE